MHVLFLHGWSVTSDESYGELPEALVEAARQTGDPIQIHQIFLGRYISFQDEIELFDIARAFEQALYDAVGPEIDAGEKIACISHSTGGPVLRVWLDLFYGAEDLGSSPISHAVMLAPANHGSALAVLGKKRVGRIRAFFNGVEPGTRVLNWLELGSQGQWDLNAATTTYRIPEAGFYPFVLTGQRIDTAWYDFLNSYTAERGGDGVIRVAGANMNYTLVRLVQTDEPVGREATDQTVENATHLDVDETSRPPATAMGVLPDASHVGTAFGIMGNVTAANHADHPVVEEILKCLRVETGDAYAARIRELAELTEFSQQKDADERKRNRDDDGSPSRFSMLVFRITDDRGWPIEDFDLYLLAGDPLSKAKIPSGFFVDRQRNSITINTLTYFVNAGVLRQAEHGRFGLLVVARPDAGFTRYRPALWDSATHNDSVEGMVRPNETTYVDIVMKRRIDPNTLRLHRQGPDGDGRNMNYKRINPSGGEITS